MQAVTSAENISLYDEPSTLASAREMESVQAAAIAAKASASDSFADRPAGVASATLTSPAEDEPLWAFPFPAYCVAAAVLFELVVYNAFCWRYALEGCKHPLSMWFLGELALISSVFLALGVGRRAAGEDAQLWYMQPPCIISAIAFTTTWAASLPIGIWWLERGWRWYGQIMTDDMAECVPDVWTVVIPVVLILSSLTTFVYAVFSVSAIYLGRSLREGASKLHNIVDDDLIKRWGHPKARLATEYCGLSVEQLAALHVGTWDGTALEADTSSGASCVSCSICLDEVKEGDQYRRLPCGHAFHRPCVDLWLLCSPKCPLCAVKVSCDKAA